MIDLIKRSMSDETNHDTKYENLKYGCAFYTKLYMRYQ